MESPQLAHRVLLPRCAAALLKQFSHLLICPRRYLLNLDGITASRRFATLLSLNSLVLKQESEWEE